MREIKFRAWDMRIKKMMDGEPRGAFFAIVGTAPDKFVVMQYTGLKDKNVLTEVYEGDIIDENGIVKGNIYESPQIYKEGIDCLIEGMGTETWRNTESIAMGRGCRYSK